MGAAARWWDMLRLPARGAVAAVLLALIGAVLLGHAGVFRHTVEEGAQDFGIFLASARHAAAGRSLYAPQERRTATGRFSAPLNLNLPHTMALVRPLAHLTDRTALLVWMSAGLALGLAASLASLVTLRWPIRPLPALAVALYLIAWAPSAAITSTAQITFYVMVPVVAGWLAFRAGRSTAAGAWIGVAAAMKPFLLIFAPYFLIRRDRRALVAMLLAVATVCIVGVSMFGVSAYQEWATQLPRVTWSAHFLNASLLGALQRLFGRTTQQPLAALPQLVLPVAAVLASVIGTLTLAAAGRAKRDAHSADTDWSVLLLASLLMSPLGWNYYLWIAVWPVAAVIGWNQPWRRPTARDLWLVPGLGGWLWWGTMTGWGQPHAAATLTAGSLYFWALLSLWIWTIGVARRAS